MTTVPTRPAPTRARVPFPRLAKQAVNVKTTFEVFSWVVIVATVFGAIGLINAGFEASDTYNANPYVNTDYSTNYYIAAVAFVVYGAFVWAGVKLAGLLAGHIANKN